MLGPTWVSSFRIKFARKTSGLILDCAAGTGTYQQFFGSRRIVSFDLHVNQLSNISGLKVCGNAVHLPFKDNIFDTLWACGLVQYIPLPLDQYLSEWVRVTKPDGRIFIFTPNRDSLFSKISPVFGHQHWEELHNVVRLYSVAELRKYGKVYGEIRFLPFLNLLTQRIPSLGHTLMLEMTVAKK